MTQSTERERAEFIEWVRENYKREYSRSDAEAMWAEGHISARSWQAARLAQVVHKCSECEDTGVGVSHGYDCTSCYGEPSSAHEPIETVRYWRDAYANPRGDAHFMGHGMVVKILDDYLARLAAAPWPPETATSEAAPEVSHAATDVACNPSMQPELATKMTEAMPENPTLLAPVQLPEPDVYIFQHEETGFTTHVDATQIEWGFEENNKRWKRVGSLYTEQQVRELLVKKG